MSATHPFEHLTPDFIIDAVESQGYLCDGRQLALNSYENRVYQIGIEEQQPLIAKFYRPARWTDEQILEEHQFCFELAEQELPIVAPLSNAQNQSLFFYGENEKRFRFALYPRKGGHAPEFSDPDQLIIIGRLLARIHRIGAVHAFQHRPAIDSQTFGHQSVTLIREQFIPTELKASYAAITQPLLETIDTHITNTGTLHLIRTHGDCHAGNMLWRDDAPHFVDFDDARMAPAIQDLWMLLSGDRTEQTAQFAEILEGYREFNEFDLRELQLIEALRSLRLLHYSAWLASRWNDPAFPHNFPWFNTSRYWEEHILQLREQRAALDESPLMVY